MALLGYLFGVSAFYQVGPFIRITIYTSAALLLLAIANLLLRPDVGLMKLITSQTPGGMAARRLLPVAVMLPPMIGFLRLLGQELGYYGTAEGTSISVLTYVVLFSCFIYWSARQMNITARAKYEAEQRFLAEETARANELQAALHTRDEFLSIASHELKTPLTSLKLQLQMQKRAFAREPGRIAGNEKLVHFLETSDRQIQRISRLIEDMLDVGRIHSGKFTLSPEEFDLVELVKEVCEQMAGELAAGGCRVSLELPPQLVGRWDRIRMGQVLANLLSNAAKYGGGNPIEIKMKVHDERVRLTVKDYGEGIDPVNHRRIFERFERAVPGTHISGMGLGLFIVKQIVDLHGGWIRVDSALGQGATFTLDFPARIA
jgi:signal transduction histidine kinase